MSTYTAQDFKKGQPRCKIYIVNDITRKIKATSTYNHRFW